MGAGGTDPRSSVKREQHIAVTVHMNASCRDENNVTSLLEGAWSIFSPCPAFLSLSSSTPRCHLLLNILSAFSNVFHHLTLTPKLSQPLLTQFQPYCTHGGISAGLTQRLAAKDKVNSSEGKTAALNLLPQNTANLTFSPLLWTNKRKSQYFRKHAYVLCYEIHRYVWINVWTPSMMLPPSNS